MIRVGVAGYSAKKFDYSLASTLLAVAFKLVEDIFKDEKEFSCVSGLTDIGIPALAYRYAKKKGWRTVGIACKKAYEDKCFDVDEKKIVGDNWGDESETFLDNIDVFIRVGGGKQSMEEEAKARKRGLTVLVYDLPAID